ncbi:MAG: hypothetical protein K6D90_05695 [Lachnospiraceae bacterium]|nr:hypothetical protein [Lachnospiraceae bacterium]
MTKHQTMTDAASAAGKICANWLDRKTGNRVDLQTLPALAKALDAEFEAAGESPAAFLCSKEGALGLTMDFEYHAQWFLFPLPKEEDLEQNLTEDLKKHLNDLADIPVEELERIWKP